MATEQDLADRQARLARNQSLFREVNERVNDVHELFSHGAPVSDWVCECGDQGCAEHIALTYTEYETLRARPTRFAVVPADSHVFPEVEHVVERNERYWVVEKIETAAKVAARFNPRKRTPPGE